MTTYYTSNIDGNASYDGLSPTHTGGTNGPKATIAGGLALCTVTGDVLEIVPSETAYAERISLSTAQAGKSLTIRRYGSSGRVTLNLAASYAVDVDSNYATATCHIEHIVFGALWTTYLVRHNGGAASNLTFANCDFGGAASLAGLIETTSGSATDRNATFTDCTWIVAAACAGGCFETWRAAFGAVRVIRGSYKCGSGCNFVRRNAGGTRVTVGEVTFEDATLDLRAITATYKFAADNTSATDGEIFDLFKVTGCTVYGDRQGVLLGPGLNRVRIDGNTILCTPTGTFVGGIAIGDDGATAHNPTTRPPLICNNHVVATGTSLSHGILLGKGCDYPVCVGNRVSGNFDFLIVAKCNGALIARNELVGGDDKHGQEVCGILFAAGGSGNHVVQNTVYMPVGNCIGGALLQGSDLCTGNVIERNILCLAEDNTDPVINDRISGTDGNADTWRFDENLYWHPSGKLYSLNYGGSPPTTWATLAVAQAAWAAGTYATTAYASNDARSVEAEPRFVDLAHGDLRLAWTSPALDTADERNGTAWGAHQLRPVPRGAIVV